MNNVIKNIFTEDILLSLSLFLILFDNIFSIIFFFIYIGYVVYDKRTVFNLTSNFILTLFFFAYLIIREFFGFNSLNGFERILRISPILFSSIAFSCFSYNRKIMISRYLILINFLFYISFFILGIYLRFFIYQNNTNPIFRDISHYQWLIPIKMGFHPPFWSFFIVSSSIIIFVDKTLNKKIKLLFFLSTFIFLTFLSSRTALFNFLLIHCILLLYIFGINKKTILLLLIVLSLIPIFLFLSPYLLEKIVNLHGVSERINLFSSAVDVFENNILFGSSIGDFYTEMQKSLESKGVFMENVDPHNLFLYILGSTGFIGFFLFLLMIFNVSIKNVVYYIFLISFLLSGLTETIINRQMGVLLFSIFWGIIINESIKNEILGYEKSIST